MRLADRADALRDARRFRDAAILYEQALELWPRRVGIQVQAAHMFKEAGDHEAAGAHYRAAAERAPHDAEIALQLGHFHKVAGDPVSAAAAYRRALTLRPDWGLAMRELTELEAQGRLPIAILDQKGEAGALERDQAIVAALLPTATPEPSKRHLDMIELRRLGGRHERTEWGMRPLLSGIEAIRGICFTRATMSEIALSVDGERLHAEPISGTRQDDAGPTKYVFNVWADFSRVRSGLRLLELAMTGQDAAPIIFQHHVVVAAPRPADRDADSDTAVTADLADPRDVEAQVNALPSVRRTFARSALQRPISSILVLRTDQLGDLVVSVPALRRLRALFPEAHIVGLLTDANVDLARQLGLFDEAIAIRFPDDPAQRRRVMTAEDQLDLRRRLAPYRFDIALDLAVADTSRPLLLLSGARYLYGFGDAEWPWLSAGCEGSTHDPANHHEAAPQSGRILAMIERLGTIVDSGAAVIRRPDLDPARLAAFGVEEGRYAVLHTGARIAFSRWSGYPELGRDLIKRTDLSVLLLTDDEAMIGTIPPELVASPRFRVIDRRLDFDDFDTLIAGCAVFVGNDSGPKHLAALRGVPVVSIHSARVNWNEWGQELTGTIISRRVPCARCALYHDPDECGKGYACMTRITVAEVLDAVLAQLGV